MKKQNSKNEQLKLFSSSNTTLDIKNTRIKKNEKDGKQIFLNPREEIYNRILNRKME
ncbi:hypothetical protein [Echinicola rosea]|uniref:Uncharacterized protein n=1 Tax=Echinicola rosea TaxID=1807691 RepID=A0ABQ1VBR0_9BACT|nr:hypothetical protein [Echinicola rosea]GGF49689.1 hypothetical protein GCM10011339_42850 [Echinicola rosea]